ncbi:hypothetical protein K7X08_007984 [Anisodus acutangulus]|uniref:Uncharacterized protein n=1 Tax=Anisodus acutangulus TaxID=402998 RepID=A0A9Q1MSU4_9SOLA|nr:hypothetical protein K7X08_007984 [Anisodus acutangulus]
MHLENKFQIHYPAEAIQKVDFSESKAQLLEAQKAELRCLLPRSLLNRVFSHPSDASGEDKDKSITMKEDEIYRVSSLLKELVGSGGEKQPTDGEVQAAIWEACGDSGAFQLFVDLLNMKMLDLEEGSGTELLEKACTAEITEDRIEYRINGIVQNHLLSRNRRSSIIYLAGRETTNSSLPEGSRACIAFSID